MDKSIDYNNLPVNEDLHSQAGLTDVGLDEDGNVEWIGTQKQWKEFERLSERENDEEMTLNSMDRF